MPRRRAMPIYRERIKDGAVEKTGTSKGFRALAPQASASTNSATTARDSGGSTAWTADGRRGDLANPRRHRKLEKRPRAAQSDGPATSNGGSATRPCPMTRPWRRWRRASPRSAPARRPNWSGCWSIRRSTPPAPARRPRDLIDPRFPVFRSGPRRAIHLSRAGPAGGLCHARSEAARRRTCAPCRTIWRNG